MADIKQTTVPAPSTSSFRWVDNVHILFWLIKDMCWAMVFRPLGMLMIAPTLGIAVYILWLSRRHRVELFHNIAVVLWIMANSIWMTGEFFGKELRPYAVALFVMGVALLLFYYLVYFRTDRRAARAPQDTVVH